MLQKDLFVKLSKWKATIAELLEPSYASVNRIKNVALLGPRIMNIGLCKIGCRLFGLIRLLSMLEISVAMYVLPVIHKKSIMSTVWF